MVARDRNHPSIIFWSLGNEIFGDFREGGRGPEIAKQLTEYVKSLDTTRPITCGGTPGYVESDVSSINYSWRNYETVHAQQPKRVIVLAEPSRGAENHRVSRGHAEYRQPRPVRALANDMRVIVPDLVIWRRLVACL
jgi:beta-galactosidase